MNRLFFQPHQAGLSKVQAAEHTLRYNLEKWVSKCIYAGCCSRKPMFHSKSLAKWHDLVWKFEYKIVVGMINTLRAFFVLAKTSV